MKKRPEPSRSKFLDILTVARVLSSSDTPEKVLENVLDHLCDRLGKRIRCAFFEGNELTLSFWAGDYVCPIGGVHINRSSVVWDTVKKGIPANLTEPGQAKGYLHTLSEPINVKAIIPLSYAEPLSGREIKIGALIVDSGKESVPISAEDFEYLQVIGELLSAIVGRKELIDQLMTSCGRQETILMETAHNFRNRITIIGGFSRRIVKLAGDTELKETAVKLYEEIRALESNLAEFESYMSDKS